MGKINIEGLEFSACNGGLEFEKVKPQKFVFDAELTVGLMPALNDELSSTVNYAEVCSLLEEAVTGNSFNLIEKLALECAFKILEKFSSVDAVKLTVNKPQAPITQKFKSVGVTVELERVKAYLSLGSSVGDRQGYLNKAISALDGTRGITVEKVSPFMETAPYGGVAKNKFVNCAVCVQTFLPPHSLLDEINRIEQECGRVRDRRWDDRTLDIDIIFYGDKIICDERLTVPHCDYKNREFVKIPLKKIAPHLID